MAEEQQGQEKTEEATPRKLEKSREEGQVARSRELNSVAIVTFGALAALFVAPGLARDMLALARRYFEQAGQPERPLPTYLLDAVLDAGAAALPLAVVLFLAGLGSSLCIGGLVMSGKAMAPKLERMSLIKGFGRMFSVKSLMELAKSVAKFVLISGVAIGVLSLFMHDLLALGARPVEVAVVEGMGHVGLALVLIGCALVLVAAVDVPFQIAQHKKQLKMTKQEVKDELKDSEGKPEVRARLRALQQQISQRKMLDEVPAADVVITNPEHFSVAIRYDSGQMSAPLMVAKGVDFMAFRIREIADQHDVPMVAQPRLARAIYYSTEAGEEIPAGLYLAVAQVLAYVYQLEQYRRGQMNQAPQLSDVDVPEGFEPGDRHDG